MENDVIHLHRRWATKEEWLMHHSRVISMAWHIKPEAQQRKETSPYWKTWEGTNKTLSGNQGSPQPGAPRSKTQTKLQLVITFFFRPSPLGFRQVDQHTSAWNELTLTIGPWYNSLHGASMDPTVKRLASGQASQSWIVVTVPKKQDTKERQEATTEKANKPNNKQNPQSAKQALWKGPAKLKKSDDLCITVENFITTGEGRLWESKFYIPFQPQKRASNKSNNLMTSSCGVVWSHEAGTLATLSPL